MSDTSSGEFQVPTIILDTWKLRNPSVVLMIPAVFPAEIGKITFAWSFFETAFEGALEALGAANSVPEDKWRGWSFRRRRTMFWELLNKSFADCPTVLTCGETIATHGARLYLKRNLIVHGKLEMELINEGGVQLVKLRCTGRQNRRPVTESFTADQLDNLFYEIAHLMGHLNCLLTGDVGLPTSPERQKLEAFLKTNHPFGPIPRMHAPPPPTSQE